MPRNDRTAGGRDDLNLNPDQYAKPAGTLSKKNRRKLGTDGGLTPGALLSNHLEESRLTMNTAWA